MIQNLLVDSSEQSDKQIVIQEADLNEKNEVDEIITDLTSGFINFKRDKRTSKNSQVFYQN